MRVRETTGVARNREVVRSGVPLPRSLNINSVDRLAIVDSSGTAVPSDYRILARWNAGLNATSAPIQWLLVAFPATVGANATATYRLVTDGSVANPTLASPLGIVRTGDQMTIETGAATFVVGGNPKSLFDEIRIGSTQLATAGALTARINNTDTTWSTTRRVTIESAGPLSAVVIIDGSYDLPAVGGAGVGSHRRYIFTAGSPTAIVEQTATWEGSVCDPKGGDITCGGMINGLRVARIRDSLMSRISGSRQITAIGEHDGASMTGAIASGQSASIRQRLRTDRHAPALFEITIPGGSATGSKADGALLAISGNEGTLGIAIDHMHRFEPQALRALDDGTIAIDIADDQAWLGKRQGVFATVAIAALPQSANRASLDAALWAPLNHPLHAWPEAAWWAASDAVGEIPVGSLPSQFADYDRAVRTVLTRTITDVESLGTFGLMTYGLFPRLWGNPIYSDEIECGDNDPTPQEAWDNVYWCSTWTDYHNTASTAAIWAMRSGETEWLDEISRPAAMRSLYTQVFQCSPGDDFFYCGQAPAGYNGYRSDFNGSHAYFENLQTYYWLTGDTSVPETLKRGANSMRSYLCKRRPTAACQPDDAPIDEFANLTGRVASQWFLTFRFLGLASDDPSFLDDYQANLGRAVTQQYIAVDQGGTRYGFMLGGYIPVTAAGDNTTDQIWMTALYDMNNLDRLQRDTNDAPIGNPAMRPSEILLSLARTFAKFGSTVAPGANGTASGAWPNQMNFTWSGARIGGTLLSVTYNGGGSDPLLYDTNKGTLTAALARAAIQNGDPLLRTLATDLTVRSIASSLMISSPLGKEQGELLARLHAAVANLSPAPAPSRHRSIRH
jgi:hypothetical protein